MRFLVKAKTDNPPAYGERIFTGKDGEPLKKGDEIEISGQWYEAVNGRQYLEISDGGAFALVREIPEFDHERRSVERREKLAALEEKTKAELLKEADKLHLMIPANTLKPDVLESVAAAIEAEQPMEAFKVGTQQQPATASAAAKSKKGDKS